MSNGEACTSSDTYRQCAALRRSRSSVLLPDTLDEDGGVIGSEDNGDGLILVFDVVVQGSGASK